MTAVRVKKNKLLKVTDRVAIEILPETMAFGRKNDIILHVDGTPVAWLKNLTTKKIYKTLKKEGLV